VITKAREDLETEFVQDRLVEESDSSKIIYLQHIIFENLRLCPVVPLLASHMSSAEHAVGGYDIPAGKK
jgi:cytochrome P450